MHIWYTDTCINYIDSNICMLYRNICMLYRNICMLYRNICMLYIAIEMLYPHGMHDGRGDIAFLLTTDTGDAGTSPHVARRFFQWYSMTNIAIYIINNELRYHCSINYRHMHICYTYTVFLVIICSMHICNHKHLRKYFFPDWSYYLTMIFRIQINVYFLF